MKKLLLSFLFVCLICGCSNNDSVPAIPLLITSDDIHTVYPGLYASDGVSIMVNKEELEHRVGFKDVYAKLFSDDESGEDESFVLLLIMFDLEQDAIAYKQLFNNNEEFMEITNMDRYLYDLPEDIIYFYDEDNYLNSMFHYSNAVIWMGFYNEDSRNDVLTQVKAHQLNSLQYQKLKQAFD